MWTQNNAEGEGSALQNQFTAYLATAVRRRKAQYIAAQIKRREHEFLWEPNTCGELATEQDLLAGLPLLAQLENSKLKRALESVHRRNLYIILAHVLDKRTFADIAAELGMRTSTASDAYYKSMAKLKRELGGG